jgi:uroporphyrinogen-III synthase
MQVLRNIPIVTTNEFYSEGFSRLSENGAKVYHFPMISTSRININIETKSYTCLIFTSKNGIKYFLKNNKKIGNKKIITIGNKTAHELKKYGIKADYICSRNYSNEMSDELKTNNVLLGQKSLLVQGNISDNSLYDELKKFSSIEKIIVYKTNHNKTKDPKLDDLLNEEPYIIFTSPSCFDAFNNLYETRKSKLISIGKTTTSYIESKGFETTTTAKMQTYEGISQAIIDFFKKNKQ